jgi:hypothetical protein
MTSPEPPEERDRGGGGGAVFPAPPTMMLLRTPLRFWDMGEDCESIADAFTTDCVRVTRVRRNGEMLPELTSAALTF